MNLLQLLSQDVRYTSARFSDTMAYALPSIDDDVPSSYKECQMFWGKYMEESYGRGDVISLEEWNLGACSIT